MSSVDTKQSVFAKNLMAGEYDDEIKKLFLDWQVENAKTRIKDFTEHLESKYDDSLLSTTELTSDAFKREIYRDELLKLARDRFNDIRKTYLQNNIDQYIHDLGYIVNPTIYITDTEWNAIRSGEANHLETYRNWVSAKIETIDLDKMPTSFEDLDIPKRGRKPKNVEEK